MLPQLAASIAGGAVAAVLRARVLFPCRKEGEQQRDRIWQADALGIIENQPAPARLWSELDAETAGPGLAKKQLGTISVVSTGAATMLKEARENDNAT